MRLLLLLLALPSLACASGPDPVEGPIRGITLSTHGIGREWADDSIVPTLEAMQECGANWFAFHPYAGIVADGTVGPRHYDPSEPPAHVLRPIAEARRLGMKTFLKPHLAYWRSPWSWRGDIEFDSEADWERFFTTYRTWIVTLAAQAGEVDLFAVGTELDRTLHRPEWIEIVAAIREVNPSPLTYAANWTDYRRVPFQDQLDVVGVQAYFPVSTEEAPDEAALRAGWIRIREEVAAESARWGQPVVFTELGYNRSFRAAAEPWAYELDGPEAEAFQALCLRVALEEVESEPAVLGSFLWKWFPEPRPVGRNFQLATPRLKGVLRDVWAAGG